MITTIDTETYKDGKPILDATGNYFILGVLKKETGNNKILRYNGNIQHESKRSGKDDKERKIKHAKRNRCYRYKRTNKIL